MGHTFPPCRTFIKILTSLILQNKDLSKLRKRKSDIVRQSKRENNEVKELEEKVYRKEKGEEQISEILRESINKNL